MEIRLTLSADRPTTALRAGNVDTEAEEFIMEPPHSKFSRLSQRSWSASQIVSKHTVSSVQDHRNFCWTKKTLTYVLSMQGPSRHVATRGANRFRSSLPPNLKREGQTFLPICAVVASYMDSEVKVPSGNPAAL